MAAAVIAIVGLVILGRDGSRGSHSFDGDLFSGYNQVSFGQYTLALYSGKLMLFAAGTTPVIYLIYMFRRTVGIRWLEQFELR